MKNIIKKISAMFIVTSCIIGAQVISESKSDAQINDMSSEKMQVIYSRKCCDSNGVVRCIIDSWAPLNSSCYCYGISGTGWVC